ncbi:hypothetical protein [Microbacterium sp. P03]|uniref:hypothetical protein n=1 Tax=Microbacterium sp. P03 TaxID=3366946 RepID=UPI003744C52A
MAKRLAAAQVAIATNVIETTVTVVQTTTRRRLLSIGEASLTAASNLRSNIAASSQGQPASSVCVIPCGCVEVLLGLYCLVDSLVSNGSSGEEARSEEGDHGYHYRWPPLVGDEDDQKKQQGRCYRALDE